MSTSCGSNAPASDAAKNDSLQWQRNAEEMVNRQIIARGITNKKLTDVMKHTPRHAFVPDPVKEYAYVDAPLAIGNGQTISQPYVVALMTDLLKLKGNEKVLEIGTGSGYQAAILARLVKTCYSVELVKPLAETAARVLKELGYNNVILRQGDGYKGWPEQAPFDHIIITAAPEKIPEVLLAQLKPGGRMVVPVGAESQELLVITKTKNGFRQKHIITVRFVPMVKPAAHQ